MDSTIVIVVLLSWVGFGVGFYIGAELSRAKTTENIMNMLNELEEKE